MVAPGELGEYLAEIRAKVCSRCVDKPLGGPPCFPLGRPCGVELHLEELIDSIHERNSPLLKPYLEHNREMVCSHCAFHYTSVCPCPMEYLAGLIVPAIEAVDERKRQRAESAGETPSRL